MAFSYCWINGSDRIWRRHYVRFTFIGEEEKTWCLQYKDNWQFVQNIQAEIIGQIRIQNDVAWRIFTKGISKDDAIKRSEMKEDAALTSHFFDMIAIME